MHSTTIRLMLSAAQDLSARWWGFGAAYRRHMNHRTGSLRRRFTFAVERDGEALFRTRRRSKVQLLEDPNGFIAPVLGWTSQRANSAAATESAADGFSVVVECFDHSAVSAGNQLGQLYAERQRSVDLTADATDPDNDTLLYTWSVTGGTS